MNQITHDVSIETMNLMKTITRVCDKTSLYQDMAVVDLSYKVIFYFRLENEEPVVFVCRVSHIDAFNRALDKKKPA